MIHGAPVCSLAGTVSVILSSFTSFQEAKGIGPLKSRSIAIGSGWSCQNGLQLRAFGVGLVLASHLLVQKSFAGRDTSRLISLIPLFVWSRGALLQLGHAQTWKTHEQLGESSCGGKSQVEKNERVLTLWSVVMLCLLTTYLIDKPYSSYMSWKSKTFAVCNVMLFVLQGQTSKPWCGPISKPSKMCGSWAEVICCGGKSHMEKNWISLPVLQHVPFCWVGMHIFPLELIERI